jgi:ParB family chromosome partitioning protein
MQNIVQSIPIGKLLAHPLNANRMSEQTFKKLVRNIEKTGLYEPIVVRPHPEREGFFQIINGHHRANALKMLGKDSANCLIWDVDDNQTAILLATLNRLVGSDILEKKQQLLKTLKENFGADQLAKILPQTKKQIEALVNLKVPVVPSKNLQQVLAKPLVFFVTDQQLKTIEKALSVAIEKVVGSTMAERKAKALTHIVNQWMQAEPDGKTQ